MKVHHTLICFFFFFFFFFLSLQDGNTGFVNAQRPLYAVTEGEDFRVECLLFYYGEKFTKFLCKETCEENILIETTDATAERGRYRIGKVYPESGFSVTIRQVTQSDSGEYSCGYNATTSQFYMPFGILVLGLNTPKPDVTLPAFSTSLPEASKQTIDVLMYSVVILVIIVIILVLVLMIICIWRKTKPDGSMTRGNAGGLNIENPLYENCPPVSTSENSDYLTLHPATRDKNQIYSTLTNIQNTGRCLDSDLDSATVPPVSSSYSDPENSAT